MNNDNQTKFLTLAKKFEALREELKAVGEEMNQVMESIGIGSALFQDPETMAVYRVIEPKGTFVEYRKIGYQRTALEGEARGDVSKKDAEAAGFVLKK